MDARRLICDSCGLEGPALVGQVHGGRCPRDGCAGILARRQGVLQAPLPLLDLLEPQPMPPAPSKPVPLASSRTYNRIVREGLLSAQRMAVYCALQAHGPCTGSELAQRMAEAGEADFGTMRHMVGRRLPELRARGVAAELEPRECEVAGSLQAVWQTTNQLPTPPVPDARRVLLKQIRPRLATADLLTLNQIAKQLGVPH